MAPRQRCLAPLVLLLAVLCFSSSVPAAQAGRRSLQQSDALSNSNGCLATIPKCEQGACATRNIMGVAKWVCLRCLANYQPVVTSDGQDNIVQCGEWRRVCAVCAPAAAPVHWPPTLPPHHHAPHRPAHTHNRSVPQGHL